MVKKQKRWPRPRRVEIGNGTFLVKIWSTWYLETNVRGRQQRKTLKTTDLREATRIALGLVEYCVTCGRKLE